MNSSNMSKNDKQKPAWVRTPFFLSVNYSHTLIGQKQNEWYKAMPMGINHLYKLTKTLIKSCPDINDNRKLTNHSVRRHLVQK
jgi:hypothetical protein